MVNYLDVLFDILLNKSLDFLRDDIIQIVYLIISNNYMIYSSNVTTSFLFSFYIIYNSNKHRY